MPGRSSRSKPFGFVVMASDREAIAAIERLNSTRCDEATISVAAVVDD